MSGRLALAVEGLFVLTEALAWYYAMHVASSIYERNVLRDVAFRIDQAVVSDDRLDAVVGAHAAEVARAAADAASAGPPLLVVLATAGAAFVLTRWLRTAGLGRFGVVLGILVSVVALSLAWRTVLVGDVRFWDYDAVARFFQSSDSPAFRPIDVHAFSANPDPSVVDGRASGLALVGVLALWLRFLYAGRSPLTFQAVLRSFSATFPVVVLATVAGSAARVPGGVVALMYFSAAVLTLALANARRATDRGEASRLNELGAGLVGRVRAFLGAPWAFAVASTLVLVLATTAVLLVLSAIHAGDAVLAIGGLVGRVLEVVLIIIVTPVYLLGEAIGRWLGIGNVDLSFLGRALESAPPDTGDEAAREEAGRLWWVREALRLAAVAALAYGVYRLGQYLFRRLEARNAANDAGDRSGVSSVGGIGSLLRAVFPGRTRAAEGDTRWLRRHPVYWLYGRMVHDATERRFAPRPGETPLEFAAVSAATLNAPVFEGIAAEFDRARYGRHFLTEEQLQPYARALRAWEEANPVTDEVRRRPRRGEQGPEIEPSAPTERPEAPPEIMPPV